MKKIPDLRQHMKLRHFRLVEILFHTRSIRLASERLNITPAAVSKACLELENILGTKLFIRKAGGLIPNPLCERLIVAGRRIDAELKNLMVDITLHEESFHDSVKIGFQTPMLQDAIVRGVAKMKKIHPNLNLTLEYASRQNLLSGLEVNQYDFIFINLTDITSRARFKTQSLGKEQYVIASMEEIHSIPDVIEKWAEFSSATWVLPIPGLAMRDRFDSVLAARGLSLPKRRIEINSPVGGEKIVALSDAYTLLPLTMLKALGRTIDEAETSLRFLPEMQLENGIVSLQDTSLSAAAQYASEFIIKKIKKTS
ncbi:LysR family transcriptional regulator [Acetobacter indonesiensis]|uniref:LysR family transcriptional regulator n=1 Tax=Acetobacter indonesiensis TaxID=104101 RepID=UPI001F23857A|nr:LysR family transcriptional regulator [Acetobacter indonesiensis]MCG0995549.1 LysR family transcriptional regulator [Acetobacter indonesiensis]